MLVFAAANSVIAKLGLLGAHNLIDGRNPISFCNVLFAANLIAGLTLLGIHQKAWRSQTLRKITVKEWILMTFLAFFSGVVGPTLFFLGLMLTQVINVVLIATIEIPLTLFFGWVLFKEKPLLGVIFGAFLTLVGVTLTFFLHQPEAMPMHMKMTMINIGKGPIAHILATLPRAGEICIALSTLVIVISVEGSRKYLAAVPEGIVGVYRMVVGAIIFFVIVLIMLGWVHFIDIFSPFLWEWMLLYGGVIIAGGLYCWYRGIKSTTSSDLAITNSFSPIAGIFFAFLILGEIPERGQIIGGVVIIFGIFIALVEKIRREKARSIQREKPKSFSGV